MSAASVSFGADFSISERLLARPTYAFLISFVTSSEGGNSPFPPAAGLVETPAPPSPPVGGVSDFPPALGAGVDTGAPVRTAPGLAPISRGWAAAYVPPVRGAAVVAVGGTGTPPLTGR